MKALRRVGVSVLVVLGLVLAPTVTQAGAASFTPTPGEYFVDTSTLALVGPGPTTLAVGVDEAGVAVFSFDSINIPAGVEVFAEGSRPLELRSAGAFTLGGLIEASGFSAQQNTPGPNDGGPGGGAGGANGNQAGSGPGGGGVASHERNGGGGGGFGGVGADGGVDTLPGPGGAGGGVYGSLDASLQGGSGGGGGTVSGSQVGGGGGGGAVKLAATSLTIGASGEVFADGGNGGGGSVGASGGGSGGGIVLHANTINVAGILSARGGDGGGGGCCGDGGGGGGGRIAYQYMTLVNAGQASVVGGESGVVGFPHGELSPQATGASGVITKTEGPSATSSPATAIGPAGATLNGIVNPHGHATTYHFQLGTSTSYGINVPVPAGAVGSDSTDHALSQAVSGLAPNTTYHYRIVADGFGLVATGPDVTFTTAQLCDGLRISKGRVKVKNGKAPIQLSSRTTCKGQLALLMKAPPKGKAKGKGKRKGSASKKKGKGRKSIPIGSASFSLEAGQAKTVAITLSAAALKRLKLGKALPATAKATTTDGAGVKKTTQANVSLKLAKKGKGPKKRP